MADRLDIVFQRLRTMCGWLAILGTGVGMGFATMLSLSVLLEARGVNLPLAGLCLLSALTTGTVCVIWLYSTFQAIGEELDRWRYRRRMRREAAELPPESELRRGGDPRYELPLGECTQAMRVPPHVTAQPIEQYVAGPSYRIPLDSVGRSSSPDGFTTLYIYRTRAGQKTLTAEQFVAAVDWAYRQLEESGNTTAAPVAAETRVRTLAI